MKFTSRNDKIRFALAPFGLGVFAILVAVRLVYLHLDLIATTSSHQPKYGFNRVTQARRGSIYSADKFALARTVTLWEYRLDGEVANIDTRHGNKPLSAEKRMANIHRVAERLNLDERKVMDAYAQTKSRYMYLTESYDSDVHAELMNNRTGIPGLLAIDKQRRIYPQKHLLSQVLGFVSKDPANAVGGAGLEQRFEKYLKGTPGQVHGTKDAEGREDRSRRDLDIDAKVGCDIYLTINSSIQYETEKIMLEGLAEHRAERAWAIVMSVKTGAILAMVNVPGYHPENFNKYSPEVKINRAISEVYEPGSVMKTITACAALNEGRVGPDTMINTARNDPNYYRLPGDAGHVWDATMSVREALVHSSNIVFGKLGYDLGPKTLYGYMQDFGLGRRTGIQLPGEEVGLIPSPQKWDKVKWSRAPIGQGVAVTAIQLAAAYACIGNNGELLRPYIVERIVQSDGEVVYSHKKEVVGNPVKPTVTRQVLSMLTGVAKKGGTAKRAALPGYTVAGKTGTAQMKEGKGYSSTNFNASFIGILPATRPEIVILVTYQKPFYCRSRQTSETVGVPVFNHQGGLCAAPTFKRIAEKAVRYLQIEPDMPDEMPDEDEDEFMLASGH